MSSSDSSDDCICEKQNFQYWNDWEKTDDQIHLNTEVKAKKPSFGLKNLNIGSNIRRKQRTQNWIPPIFIFETNKLQNSSSKKVEINKKRNKRDPFESKLIDSNAEVNLDNPNMSKIPFHSNAFDGEKLLNVKWGKRVELYDVMEYMDGRLIWGVVNLGFFEIINLWINEYGNICGFAEGTISKVGFFETSKIFITKIHLLQKILGLSHPQWTSLCEIVEQNRENLRFSALSSIDLQNTTSLKKLWYFICKRRHFLPDQCMLLKFSGVVKSLKEFKIIPKLVVEEIRNMEEEKEDLN